MNMGISFIADFQASKRMQPRDIGVRERMHTLQHPFENIDEGPLQRPDDMQAAQASPRGLHGLVA
ncbi:hypothetical protein [Pararobbsia silviterrae]|uniref:hypothetical protein n=1 Tax=Pararobbsia silviterrae TaxID=1792498 RepID=UPI00140C45A7|nr:hypothetical protein [Pararobbsia silviterrae]